MSCEVCQDTRDVKTWVYGTTCDKHDAAVDAAYRRWREANPQVYTCVFRVTPEYAALVARLKEQS